MRRIHSPVLLGNLEDARARAFVVLFTCDAFARCDPDLARAAAGVRAARRRAARQRRLLPGCLRRPGRQPDGARHPASGQAPMGADDRRGHTDRERMPAGAGDESLARCRPRPADAGHGHARYRHQPLSAGSYPAPPAQSLRAAAAAVCRRRLRRGSVDRRLPLPQRGGEPHLSGGGARHLHHAHLLLDLAACRQPEPAGGNGAAAEPAPLRAALRLPAAPGPLLGAGARPQRLVGHVLHLHADLCGQRRLSPRGRRRARLAGPGADAAGARVGADRPEHRHAQSVDHRLWSHRAWPAWPRARRPGRRSCA